MENINILIVQVNQNVRKKYNGIMKLFNELVEKYKNIFIAEEIVDAMSGVDF